MNTTTGRLTGRMLLLILSIAAIGSGCAPDREMEASHRRTELQIQFSRSFLDSYCPENGRRTTTLLVEQGGFDFLIGKEVASLPQLTACLEDLRLSEFAGNNRIVDWQESFCESTIFYCILTDFWELGDGSMPMDLLVFACENGKFIGWKLFALRPY